MTIEEYCLSHTFQDIFKVLIIDDDILLSETLKLLLEETFIEKFSIESAYDGKKAIEKLENQNFDLMFLDYNLPDLDGLSMLKELKKREIETPVILMTGYTDDDMADEAMRLGAIDYISKGKIDLDRLVEVINKSTGFYEDRSDLHNSLIN